MARSRSEARGRPRWGAVGLVVGVLVGSLVGSVARPVAAPPPQQASFRVLHVAPVLALPSAALELSAAPLCDPPDAVACQVAKATLQVRGPSGAWSALVGTKASGAFRWSVPPELVGEQGFAYYLELKTATGQTVRYPEGGDGAPLVVETTAGFTTSTAPPLSWDDVRRPDGTALALGFGAGPGQVGREDGPGDADVLTASSFDIGAGGRIYVADWVNGRVPVFGPGGGLERSLPSPVRRSFDVSAGKASLGLLTLGTDGEAFRISSTDGRVLERTPVATGVATRIVDGEALVGPGQWVEAFPGRTLAPPVPEPGPAFSQDLSESMLAARWSGADGARVGAIVTLPDGFRVGAEYFVEPQRDGGAVVTRGIWDDTHAAVGVFTFDAGGSLVDVELLPEPSARMDAVFSTVRWHDGAVYVARDHRRGLSIDVFEVR